MCISLFEQHKEKSYTQTLIRYRQTKCLIFCFILQKEKRFWERRNSI